MRTWQWKHLAIYLRDSRERTGLSQVELAERAGVSERTIQRLESGEDRGRPPRSLERMDAVLRLPPGTLFGVLRGPVDPDDWVRNQALPGDGDDSEPAGGGA